MVKNTPFLFYHLSEIIEKIQTAILLFISASPSMESAPKSAPKKMSTISNGIPLKER